MMPTKKNTHDSRSPRGAGNSADVVLATVAEHPGATANELALASGLGRSTVTKVLATLAQEGRVNRQPGGREGSRRLPDRWTRPGAQKTKGKKGNGAEPTEARLGKGELAAQVLGFLRANPGEHSPSEVAKALGGRSSGAVANALDKFVASGDAVESCPKPRRYRVAS
jgi:hypothetical protein